MAGNSALRHRPTVLHPIELASFIQYLLAHHTAPTNLIVCSSQDEFLAQLQASIIYEKDLERLKAEEADLSIEKVARIASRAHDLLIPTIHQLSTSRTITVTFCATLAQLQAYLGVYKKTTDDHAQKVGGLGRDVPILALLNPLALHKETSSFSAQGLSRSFASAVEAASRSNQKLIVVECPSRVPRSHTVTDEDDDEEMSGLSRLNHGVDPWDQQVPILNVTTKSFGAGERGWVGRTVLARRVLARWFVFEEPVT
jgi:hypothetical protein